ncbi:hypothetical protein B5K11_35670 [Rhizobium leguminosarum bv. trifolii]|uniref:hypothetical protein n=1 Tax=Rhizobium leguminosarum TaxID=384 RepID=UPI000E37308E|nr:hypothetical protein [Rhizobium leguminosarum]RFB83029.1 hypothetical protein B5K11_35670 [Rhizobium leguminosarum bv. trifolii]
MNIISHPQTVSASPHLEIKTGAEALLKAAEQVTSLLEHGKAVTAGDLRQIVTANFGGSDAEGLWLWKDAYEATEIAQVLFLRKFHAIVSCHHSPQSTLAMLTKAVRLLPTHSRRSEESQALQQFSTPIPLAFVASRAAGITSADLVLEPSAGTGLLAQLFPRVCRNFGIDPTMVIAPDQAWASLVGGSSIIGLAGGMTLRRVRVMNGYRVELTGFTDGMRDWLRSIGLFPEMINWKLRFFVPVTDQGPEILSKLMQRHRLIDIVRRS